MVQYSSPVLLAVRLLLSSHTEPTQSEAPIDLVQIHHPKGHGHGQEQEHRHRQEMDVIWTFKIYKSDIGFRKNNVSLIMFSTDIRLNTQLCLHPQCGIMGNSLFMTLAAKNLYLQYIYST
jgi:hypothetical protein